MKSILFISAELPFPPTSGGRMKSWKLVEYLGQHYELGVACALKYGDEHIEDFRNRVPLRDFLAEPVVVPRSARNLAISYLRGTPLNVYRTWSRKLMQRVREVTDCYDMIFLDHYEAAQYVPANYKGKIILHEHNACYLMWERNAESGPNIAYRTVSCLEAIRVKRCERAASKKADLVFASPNDIDSLVDIGVERSRCRVTYHLGDDSQLSLPPLQFDATEMALLYVGTLNREANVDGLLWFFEDMWPALKRRHPDLKFYLVGGNADERIVTAANSDDAIIMTGFVDEPEPWFQRGRVFVAPLRFGTGITVKVLNAMSRGIPTVTTSVGTEGLIAEHMTHIAITDTREDMLEAIDELLGNRQTWERLEQNSRALVTEHYTWARVLGDMKSEFDALFMTNDSGVEDRTEGIHHHPELERLAGHH